MSFTSLEGEKQLSFSRLTEETGLQVLRGLPELTLGGAMAGLSGFNSCRSLVETARVLSRFSRVRLFATPWTVACQSPLSMGFFRQEYWSGLPCPPPGDLPDPGIQPGSSQSPALQVGSLSLASPGKPWWRLPIGKLERIHFTFVWVFLHF